MQLHYAGAGWGLLSPPDIHSIGVLAQLHPAREVSCKVREQFFPSLREPSQPRWVCLNLSQQLAGKKVAWT